MTDTHISSPLSDGISSWILAEADPPPAAPPTEAEITSLREAFGAFFGERNPQKALPLLTNALQSFERQPPDERAALYRVRGDCYMALQLPREAADDYGRCLGLMDGIGGEKADPSERPLARLGRARALRSGTGLDEKRNTQAAEDYRVALTLTGNDDLEEEERLADGVSKNPYAAWEWGMSQRGSGNFLGAAKTHARAMVAFETVGDHAAAVISALDRGIDLAAASSNQDIAKARDALELSIRSTPTVKGDDKDIPILQRVIAKEGEARMALASILWDANERSAAETELGEACARLEQLDADADARDKVVEKKNFPKQIKPLISNLGYSIDDILGAREIGCSSFKRESFLTEKVQWPPVLQEKVLKLQRLK
eukprot:CAMPEP_0171309466 /NCGR_PEP_ID=MMETSP0816-20121228/19626_1 /TAXON_ID=420281 /ORGANISM="Proboscia inermis, Strain CCAP1064/1" /LENGTH=371 /DNA_ID=CAMNT_0011793003 /DNA_START=53 /DNA_END=1168 /DNA_ORIENTATION=+